MWIILGALVAGVGIGLFFRPAAKNIKVVQRLQQAGVVLLLFCMGAGIGTNRELIANLRLIGLKAAVFAAATVFCSIAAVYWVTRKASAGRDKQ